MQAGDDLLGDLLRYLIDESRVHLIRSGCVAESILDGILDDGLRLPNVFWHFASVRSGTCRRDALARRVLGGKRW